MQLQGLIQALRSSPSNLSAESGLASSSASMPFNPINLICLIVWVYVCLYFVQRVQFSPLVPKRYKSAAYIVTLFTGPILLLLLLIVDSVRKSSQTGDSIIETVKEQIEKAIANIRSNRLERSRKDSIIRLLDSSGRNLSEIYGHGDSKQKDRHVLDLTERVVAEALARRASDILIDKNLHCALPPPRTTQNHG